MGKIGKLNIIIIIKWWVLLCYRWQSRLCIFFNKACMFYTIYLIFYYLYKYYIRKPSLTKCYRNMLRWTEHTTPVATGAFVSISFQIGSFIKQTCFFFSCIHLQSTVKVENTCDGCLFLTPLIKNGSTALARSLSRVDPEQFCGLESHSGFITVKEEYNSNLFFWYFPHKKEAKTKAWIIWLQGGPGFSSLVGLFNIMGPLEMVDGERMYLFFHY